MYMNVNEIKFQKKIKIWDHLKNFITLKSIRSIRIGFFFVCFLAVNGFALQLYRGFTMDSTWTFSTGTEVLGTIICAIIYYSCMQSMEEIDSKLATFITLLIPCSLCLFLDEIAWLVQGIPDYIFTNSITNATLHISYYTIGLLFWLYYYSILKVKSNLTQATNTIFSCLYILMVFVCVADMFYPIYFYVDQAGNYQRTVLYVLRPFIYLTLIPAGLETLIRSNETLKIKIVVSMLYLIPIMAEVLTFFEFGISTKPAAILIAIIINYGVVISNRGKKYAKTKNELDIASRIQVGLLPNTFPAFPDRKDFDIYAVTIPAREVGGDYYDFFMLDDDHIAILIADVSDKGMGAALFMTITRTLINTRAQLGGTPSEIIKFVDARVQLENEAGMFVTTWLGIIDLRTGHVDACNAGHDYPAIMKKGKDFVVEKTQHGPPIGFIPGMEFPDISFKLNPGERIFLYTDGIVEAKKSNSDRFNVDRMLEVLNKNKNSDDKELILAVRDSVNAFAGKEPQFDDMTMLSFTYKG